MDQFKSIETTELVKIANAIRTKTSSTEKISLKDMSEYIKNIEGGSSGGSIETCTVTLVGDMMPDASRIVYYANGSATHQSVTFPSMMYGTIKISVVKNSIIFLAGAYVASGNITRLYIGTYFVTGDATIRSN